MKNFLPAAMAAIMLIGCKDFKKSIDDTLNSPAETAGSGTGDAANTPAAYPSAYSGHSGTVATPEKPAYFTSQKDKLQEAENKLRALPQFAGKPIFIYQFIHFYDDGRIITKLQNPDNPEYIDEYTYDDGMWQKPEPVVLSKNDNIKEELIPLDRIPFEHVVNVYHVLEEKRKEIGSQSQDYTLYAGKRKGKIHWYPGSIQNERSSYDIEYNEDGTLKSFEQR